MADEFTPNIGLFLPKGSDSMADVKKNLTDNFNLIAPYPEITVIAAGNPLPQVGNYDIGDIVFRNDAVVANVSHPSIYVLVCKDAVWGWHWRPYQQINSPWVDLTVAVVSNGSGFLSINPTYKLQISLDSRGFVHWRGAVEVSTAGVLQNFLFNNIPLGLRPATPLNKMLAVSPVSAGAGTGVGAFIGCFVTMTTTEPNYTLNVQTDDAGPTAPFQIWFDGFTYQTSYSQFYNA